MKSSLPLKLSMFATGIALIAGSMLLPGSAISTLAGPPLVITGSPDIPPPSTPTSSVPGPFADPYVLKSCSPTSVVVGQDTEFTITAGNRGTTDAVNVQVRDTLPAYLTLKSVTASPRGTIIRNGNSFIVDIGTLGVTELITIKVVATVNDQAKAGNCINVATLNTTSGGDNPNNNVSVCVCNIGQVVNPPSGGEPADFSFVPWLMMALGAILIVGSLFVHQRRPEGQQTQ